MVRVRLFCPCLLRAVCLLGVLAGVSAIPAWAAHGILRAWHVRVHGKLRYPYAPAHTWAVFAEYSPSSSHIILGVAREREFAALGVAYTHNMYRGRHWDLSYLFEIRPLMAESDPVIEGISFRYQIPGYPNFEQTFRYPHKIPVLELGPRETDSTIDVNGVIGKEEFLRLYGRRWTYVGAMSPLGLKVNLFPRSRLQPTLTANGGFAASARDIPMFDTSAGNFTFSFGGGVDLFRRVGHPIRLEYRIQHFSNAEVGQDPGIDSQMIYVGYVWGQ